MSISEVEYALNMYIVQCTTRVEYALKMYIVQCPSPELNML